MALINCPACGQECSPQATSCPHCGQPLNRMTPPPKTWLLESILVTVLCCIIGVVGIVYAAKVENLWYQGRQAEAIEASKTAKTWTLVALFISLGAWLIYFLLIALGVFAGFMDAFNGF